MRIIAYKTAPKEGQVLLEESTGDSVLSNDVVELFTFLVNQFEEEGECIKVCWNLDVTVSLFLRLLGEIKCSQLKGTKRCHIAPFEVFYVPEKVFSVVHIPTKAKANLYWIEQYFPELEEPDLNETKLLGEMLWHELKKMGLEPTKLTSPIAIYDECVMKKLDLPKLKDIPMKAANLAYRAAGKLWIESYVLGYFDKAYIYDMSSAFPRAVQTLIDTRDCYWKESDKYQEKAIYGYVEADIEIYDWVKVHPILREMEEGVDSPTGKYPEVLNKKKLDFINKWGIGEYKIKDGIWAIPVNGRTLRTPWAEPMAKLLAYKQGSLLQKLIAKRAATGVWGRMGEERAEEFGPDFFPPWFAEASIDPTLEVGEFLYQHKIGPRNNKGMKHLTHIGVDSVMLDCPIEEIK